MTAHIDVSSVLRHRVCELYSDLVTRPTGRAVRTAIEQQLTGTERRTLTVIDFSNVGLLDFSCADEVVAKLLLRYCVDEAASEERYFVFRGVSETHLDAIEAVLERHQLALVADDGGGMVYLVGVVDDAHRVVWETLCADGRCAPSTLAERLSIPSAEAERLLDALHRRRLLMRSEDGYLAIGGRVA